MTREASEWPAQTLLGRLSGPARQVVCRAGARIDVPGGRVVFRQGEDSRHVLVLLSGSVKVALSTAEGYEALLAVRVGGEVVGELAAVDGEPRSATVVTCAAVSARRIGPEELRHLGRLHPEIDVEIRRTISRRLRWANQQRVDLRAYDAPTRVGRIIARLVEMYGAATSEGVDLGIPLRQAELASMAGVSLPAAEKALSILDQQGLIARGYRRLVVRDLAGLRQVSQLTDQTPY
ncbi:Crp/Fnr family transcriptional regulator [Micromonospora cathayae]|uniref:Crp/Fnr family transcriptional regulator n=1 Tax=Micromonospora cathayae TaxID=3028804 RepID=A0ABY7ZSY3_9ACTN|nr:Crp/Fnr family transcriptional regulator [Micromonospora sp. HUAS 3]WDZ86010.1 Crp/Fnr family transcriptional regulator [Micromonospora sp. HUAS 3]